MPAKVIWTDVIYPDAADPAAKFECVQIPLHLGSLNGGVEAVLKACPLEKIQDGDVFLVPRGYHGPSVASPNHDLYYLNVIAGPAAERTMAFCDDPVHHWVREAWSALVPDPRVPMTSARGRNL